MTQLILVLWCVVCPFLVLYLYPNDERHRSLRKFIAVWAIAFGPLGVAVALRDRWAFEKQQASPVASRIGDVCSKTYRAVQVPRTAILGFVIGFLTSAGLAYGLIHTFWKPVEYPDVRNCVTEWSAIRNDRNTRRALAEAELNVGLSNPGDYVARLSEEDDFRKAWNGRVQAWMDSCYRSYFRFDGRAWGGELQTWELMTKPGEEPW